MKLLAICLVCFAVDVFSQQAINYFQKVESVKVDCLTESNVKSELAEKLFSEGEFSDDKDFKCFLKCILVKTNAMNAAGIVQEDVWKSQFPPGVDTEKVNVIVNKCKDQTGADACEMAYNAAKCAVDTIRMG